MPPSSASSGLRTFRSLRSSSTLCASVFAARSQSPLRCALASPSARLGHESAKAPCGCSLPPTQRALSHVRHVVSDAAASSAAGPTTIYALSTAPGRAAIAVIRISGPACTLIYEKLCPGKKLPRARHAAFRTLYDPSVPSSVSPKSILEPGALVIYFRGPHTVTGEDVLELHVHGGLAMVRAVLSAIPQCASARCPVRYAEPGEFTRRAFENDRMDLTQVEALGDTLSAVTEEQRRLSVQGSSGKLALRYEGWRNDLLQARGELEALIDFSEDQHFDESPTELVANVAGHVQKLLQVIDVHRANAVRGELLRHGISISLIGSPNVGKSSLLNLIVGREAAIVSREAGTTRDIVEIGVDIGGFYCRLGDTAGLRGHSAVGAMSAVVGEVEREGMARARAKAESSDVVILLLCVKPSDNGGPGHSVQLEPEVVETARALVALGKRVIVGVNKMDLLGAEALEHEASIAARVRQALPDIPDDEVICFSCNDPDREMSQTKRQRGRHGTVKEQAASGNLRNLLQGLIRAFRDITAAVTTAASPLTTATTATTTTTTTTAATGSATGGAAHADETLHPDGTTRRSEDMVQAETEADSSVWAESLGASERQRLLLDQCAEALGGFLHAVRARPHPADQDGDGESLDLVVASESLRRAGECLAKMTGRGAEAGDVEEVLGVVFER